MPTEKTYLELSEDDGASHKFYEVATDATTVTIRYGRIGTDGAVQTQQFGSEDEARKFAAKKLKEKSSKGYAAAVAGVRQKRARTVTRRMVEAPAPNRNAVARSGSPATTRIPAPSVPKAPLVWSFQSGSIAFGIFVDDRFCWVGNEAGRVFKLNHAGEVLSQYQLPDGVKCVIADNDWIYLGCDDGNVYDLTGKIPRVAYAISEDVDIYWLDVKNGLLGVSDDKGVVTVINYNDEEQWRKQGRGNRAWMVRCDESGWVFTGDGAGVACYDGVDGTQTWHQPTDSGVLFGWQERETVYAGTASGKVYAFSKQGDLRKIYQADAAVYSCATAENGQYVFAGDNGGSVYCFRENGERLWKLATGCGSACSMQYHQGKVYVVTTHGTLACLDADPGAILNAQYGVLPAAKSIAAPAPVAVVETTVLETVRQPADTQAVTLRCVKEGGKLRMKVVSAGYRDWYVQFPNNLRQEGAVYLVDEIREVAQGGFYRAYGNIYGLE
ncbi:MAG: WGR domain-containing protein [Ferruginibacter sp.]|nr:WGR domain-containing protein [Cytophagales bacterium]